MKLGIAANIHLQMMLLGMPYAFKLSTITHRFNTHPSPKKPICGPPRDTAIPIVITHLADADRQQQPFPAFQLSAIGHIVASRS